jgi:iron complex outermembrane receptor protein
LAAFAQVEYDLYERTTLIAGARWTRDEKEIDYDFSCSDLAGGFVCGIYSGIFAGSMQFGPPGQHLEFEDDDWSGKLELDFHASDDVLLYGSINRGIKSGGFNAVVPAFYDASVARFEPETLTAYELGIKADPNDWLRVNGSAFYYDYEDFQSFLVVGGFLRTINVDSEIRGADLEVAATPGEGWLLNLGVSYLDTESKDVPLPNGVGTGTFDNPISPEWTINGLVRYEWSLPLGRIGAQVDAAYVDERTTNAVDVPVLRLDSYTRANVRLTYASADERWNAALWVDNITDEDVLIQRLSLVGLLGSSASIFDKPRWWGVSLGYRW